MRFGLFLLLLLAGPLLGAEAVPSRVHVEASQDKGVIVVSARYTPPVSRALAFEVLTDYERMSEFVPGMRMSRITGREGRTLRVSQQGSYQYGVISLTIDSRHLIELRAPDEIVSRALDTSNGDYQSTTRLQQLDDATAIEFRAVWQPTNALLASLGSAAVREQVRSQLEGLQLEMLRRAQRAATLKAEAQAAR